MTPPPRPSPHKRAGRAPIDPRLLRHARTSRPGVAGLTLLGAGQAGVTLLVAVALSRIVAGSGQQAITLLAAAFGLRAVLTWAEQVVAQRTAARVTDELRRSALAATLRHGPAWAARYGSGRLSAVLTNGLDALRPWFSGYLPALVLGVALPPLVVVAMAVVDPASALVALLTLPLIPVLGALIGWATQAKARQRWDADARLAGHFLDVVQGLPTLRIYGRAERQIAVVAEMTEQHRSATMRVLRVAFLSSTALDLVGTLSVGLIAVEAGLRVANGSLALGPALLVILLAPEAYRPLREMAARYHASTDAAAVISDIDEILTPNPSRTPELAPANSSEVRPTTTPQPRRTPELPPAPDNSPEVGPGTVGTTTPRPGRTAELIPAPNDSPDVRPGTIGTTTPRPGRTAELLSAPNDSSEVRPATPHTTTPPPGRTAELLSAPNDSSEVRPATPPTTSPPPGRTAELLSAPNDSSEVRLVGEVGVRASGIRVRYPGSRVDALRLDRLDVRGGEIVALRGPSGAGKTTALRVLAGLQPLDAGTFAVDGGRPLYLPQRPTLPHARTVEDLFAAVPVLNDRAPRPVATTGPASHGAGGIIAAAASPGRDATSTTTPPSGDATPTATSTPSWNGIPTTPPGGDAIPTATSTPSWNGIPTTPPGGDATPTITSTPSWDGRPTTTSPPGGDGRPTAPASPSWAGVPTATATATANCDGTRTATAPPSWDRMLTVTAPRGRDGMPPVSAVGLAVQGEGGAGSTAVGGRDSAEVWEALRAVGLEGEIAVGAVLGEHGGGVSAGQRQRLALAALLYQANGAPVTLLLDEPTAHLDVDAERLVIARLREAASAGCAVLVVAHRPALLAAADRVIDVKPPSGAPGDGGRSSANPQAIRRVLDDGDGRGGLAGVAAGNAGMRAASWRHQAFAFRRAFAAVALGAASWLAGVVLTGAAAWLLVRASALPPVLTLSAAVVLVRASAVARPLLRYLERLVGHELAFARLGERRARVYADLIPRVPGPRLRRRGDLLTRVVDDVDAQVDGVLRGWLPAASAAFALGVAGVAAVLLLPAVGVPLATGLAIAAGLAPALAGRQAARRDAATGRARAELRDAIVETVDGIEELAARGGVAALDVPDRRSRVLSRLEARAARAAGLAAGLGQLGWGIAVVGSALALAGTGALSAEWSAVLLLGVVTLAEPVAVLPDAEVARQRAAGARSRLAELTTSPTPDPPPTDTHQSTAYRPKTQRPLAQQSEAPQAKAQQAKAQQTKAQQAKAQQAKAERPDKRRSEAESDAGMFSGAVRVRGLVAGWDPAAPPVLRGLDLDLPAGARIAILGPSGGGKSTLAAVLTKLLNPRAGTVELGHIQRGPGREEHGWVELGKLSDPVIRNVIGLVSDDADHVFASSVRENLRLAEPTATDPDLTAALTRVGLVPWVAQLPQGLDTWLGASGTTMSGGQRRRLATARALLANPALLILDEPTEGLDEDSAEALMADLLDATTDRTVLLITHRTDGLTRVDQTYHLTGGLTQSPEPAKGSPTRSEPA